MQKGWLNCVWINVSSKEINFLSCASKRRYIASDVLCSQILNNIHYTNVRRYACTKGCVTIYICTYITLIRKTKRKKMCLVKHILRCVYPVTLYRHTHCNFILFKIPFFPNNILQKTIFLICMICSPSQERRETADSHILDHTHR